MISRTPLSRVEANAFRGWQMVPGEMHYTYQHPVQINRLGLRGDELPEIKAQGEHRILALGDSTIYGQGVADSDTLPAQLEVALEARSGESWTVINAGHRAYGTNQELGLLRELGSVLDPDVVILFWYHNDFQEYDIPKTQEDLLTSGRRTFDVGAQFSGKARLGWEFKQILRRSALVMCAHDILMAVVEPVASEHYERTRLEHFETQLDDFRAQCEGHGWQPAFAVIPMPGTLRSGGGESSAVQRAARVRQAARERGILVLEMEAALEQLTLELGRVPTIPYDGHYQAVAHQRMADTIAPALLDL